MSIESSFFDLVVALGYDSVFPNVTHDPAETGYWIEVDIFRNEGIDAAIDDSVYVDQGIAQINVCTYEKNGITGAIAVADAIAAAIPKGTFITGSIVVNKRPVVLSYLVDDTKLIIPVSFQYSRI